MSAVADPIVDADRPGRPTGDDRAPLVDGWSIALITLGALLPFANYLNANVRKLVWPATVGVDALLWLVLSLLAFVAVRALTRRTPPNVIATAYVAFNLSFWNFFRWLPYEPATEARRWLGLLIWAIATAVLVRVAMILGRLANTKVFLAIFLSVWIVALLIGAAQGKAALAGSDVPVRPPTPAITFGDQRPNVYWLMLDEHARTDELARLTGSDNSWFDRALTDRGFSVSGSSTTAYVQTHLSTTSTLAMDYIWTPDHEYRGEYALASPGYRGDNPVVDVFEANGYRYVGAPDGKVEWAGCPEPGPDRTCIEPVGGPLALREPHSFLAYSTPVGSLGLPVTHNDLASIEAGVDALPDDGRPFFLFAHILSPHFPFRYEADCTYRAHWTDGYNFTDEEHRAAYANDVQCIDREVVASVDRIVAKDPDAVIIVQSDHGSALEFHLGQELETATPSMLEERYAALDAIRLPGTCRGSSIEGQPLVNTFRLVFACLSGEEPDLLEPRYFFNGAERVKTLREIDAAEAAPR